GTLEATDPSARKVLAGQTAKMCSEPWSLGRSPQAPHRLPEWYSYYPGHRSTSGQGYTPDNP
ncbi:MAG: hypothetical protein AVDCRST_MAG93-1455, partial [uncultured Chloroflexia bacterium]